MARAGGKDPWIRRAVTGELPEPHAPSALLELSSLDPGLGARAQDERRAASIARGSRRTRSEKRSGWDYASVGHLVYLVQACVKGLFLYLLRHLGVGPEGLRSHLLHAPRSRRHCRLGACAGALMTARAPARYTPSHTCR